MNNIKHVEMKGKNKKEYVRGKTKLLKSYSKNLIKGINTWAVVLVRYWGPFLKKTKDELENKKNNDDA